MNIGSGRIEIPCQNRVGLFSETPHPLIPRLLPSPRGRGGKGVAMVPMAIGVSLLVAALPRDANPAFRARAAGEEFS